jgi:hypothetical protein
MTWYSVGASWLLEHQMEGSFQFPSKLALKFRRHYRSLDWSDVCPFRGSCELIRERGHKRGTLGLYTGDNGSRHNGCSCNAEHYTAGSCNEQYDPIVSSCLRNEVSRDISPHADTLKRGATAGAVAACDELSAIRMNHDFSIQYENQKRVCLVQLGVQVAP